VEPCKPNQKGQANQVIKKCGKIDLGERLLVSPLIYPLSREVEIVNQYSILFKLLRKYKKICGENK
jgi:hypothetical protein